MEEVRIKWPLSKVFKIYRNNYPNNKRINYSLLDELSDLTYSYSDFDAKGVKAFENKDMEYFRVLQAVRNYS